MFRWSEGDCNADDAKSAIDRSVGSQSESRAARVGGLRDDAPTRAALLLALLARVHGDGAPPSPPKLLDAAGLATLRASQQPAVVRFSPENCGVDCSTLSQAWDHFSQFLPPGSIWNADCAASPDVCAACDVDAAGAAPVVKAWTGDHFVRYHGPTSQPNAIAQWLMDFAEWDLGAPGDGVGGLGGAAPTQTQQPDNGASLVAGKLQPWTGQALPTQIFLPSAAPTGRAAETGLRPVILYFHGGNDGPWEAMEQQGLARRLVENATFAAEFPFIAIMPCAECTADGTMVPFGNVLYPDGRPGFGQVGFTPRMLLRIDQLVGAALERFGGDPQRLILTATSYGGRGLYWYAAGRPRVFAALVPMATSLAPNRAISEGVCCRTGEPSCCPPVWHVVGANDPGTLPYHEKWDREFRRQPGRNLPRKGNTSEYKYTRYEWAPPPRQKEYAHMTGHAPYDLAWDPNEDAPALIAWLLERRCELCAGPPLAPPTGPDTSWRRAVVDDDAGGDGGGGGGGGGGGAAAAARRAATATRRRRRRSRRRASRRSSSRRRARATRPRLAT